MFAKRLSACLGVVVLVSAHFASTVSAANNAAPAQIAERQMPGGEGVWQLVWKDEFDRKSLGDDWQTNDRASIEDGWLHMEDRADLTCIRSFAPDIMVVFVAKADPARPPCDLSIKLAGQHLLAFGGGNNQFNQIIGGGARARDDDPEMLIEPGKVYRLVAVKEGPRLAYYCNDKLLIETTVADPVGGGGFDRFTFVTWHGMYVDYVQVYERTIPAPGGPVILTKMPDFGFEWKQRQLTYSGHVDLPDAVATGIELYNSRDYTGAAASLKSVSPPTQESVVALAYVIGDLACRETPTAQEDIAALAEALASRPNADRRAGDFATAARWFAMINFRSRNHRATRRLIGMGPENNPFYYKARMFEARYNFAHGAEGARGVLMAAARAEFSALKEIWPDLQVLREWTGENIPWGVDLIHDESDGPAWARFLHEAFARQSRILQWWFTVRHAPDGSLGGGWGDDVELLRTWVPVACITNANEEIIAGIERLSQGIWDNVLVDGYDNTSGDVEHTAEPSADTLPTMILLRYGDPLWLERNLRSAKTIREKFMGTNERGFLQFKSSEFGTRKINIGFQHGGDTGYCARACKHFIWLAWYGVSDARKAFLDWCDCWLDVTMRRIGAKPAGVVPPTVWWPGGGIDPPNGAPWYDEDANYYGYPGLTGMIHESFLTAYQLGGDRRYLDAIQTMMEMSSVGPLRSSDLDRPPDQIDNILASVAHQSSRDITATYRFLTGDTAYDEYTMRFPTAFDRYLITENLDQYAASFEKLAMSLRNNWLLRTQEVLQTDRAALSGALPVLSAYTGAVTTFRDSKTMTQSVTYVTTHIDFASLVTVALPERLRIRVYNFDEEPMRMGIRPWRLLPGVYVLNAGSPVPGERKDQARYTWGEPCEVTQLRKGEPIWIDVPPHREWVVDLRLRRRIERPSELPDLAIGAGDIKVSGADITVTVHNIGNAPSAEFAVALQRWESDEWREVTRTDAKPMDEIEAFMPVRQLVTLTGPEDLSTADWRVVLDPDDRIDELYELNNAVTLGP